MRTPLGIPQGIANAAPELCYIEMNALYERTYPPEEEKQEEEQLQLQAG